MEWRGPGMGRHAARSFPINNDTLELEAVENDE
jgi:hypothetical protein